MGEYPRQCRMIRRPVRTRPSRELSLPPLFRRRSAGFSFVEVHLALAILATGLLALSSLMVMQSRQIRRAESWCKPDPTFYVVSQSNKWMRRLQAPANLDTSPGGTAWTPSVSGTIKYEVWLYSLTHNIDSQTASADVWHISK